MMIRAKRQAFVIALPLALIGLGVPIGACSGRAASTSGVGSDGGGVREGGGQDGSADGGTKSPTGPCADAGLTLYFSPMYSAYIPGSTAQTFQLPAITNAADALTVTWSASDPNKALTAPDPDLPNGVLITVVGAGSVDIVALASDGTCGVAPLQITPSTEADWQIGNARFNQGASAGSLDAGPACSSCHGMFPPPPALEDIPCTPMQLGGLRDQELIDIIVHGAIPDGGYFDPDLILPDASGDPSGQLEQAAYAAWHAAHQWVDLGAEQQAGIVVYLRSLVPTPIWSTGSTGPGGGHHHDAGAAPGPGDAGSVADAAGGD
jgi:hypothetical protein